MLVRDLRILPAGNSAQKRNLSGKVAQLKEYTGKNEILLVSRRWDGKVVDQRKQSRSLSSLLEEAETEEESEVRSVSSLCYKYILHALYIVPKSCMYMYTYTGKQ